MPQKPPTPPAPPTPPGPPATRPSRTLPRSGVSVGSRGATSADDMEKLQAIRDVMDYAVRVTIQTAMAKPMKSIRARPILLGILACVALAISTYTFVSEPDWVFGPAPAAAPPERSDAHLRFAMFLAAQRIEALRDSAGAPPASLAAIGEEWSGLEYRVFDLGVFELRGSAAAGGEIIYKSGEDLQTFLGDARTHLREPRS